MMDYIVLIDGEEHIVTVNNPSIIRTVAVLSHQFQHIEEPVYTPPSEIQIIGVVLDGHKLGLAAAL